MKHNSISTITTHVVKPIMAITAMGATMFLLAACGNKTDAAANKESITTSVPSALETMDPDHSVDTTSGEILNNVEEGLVYLGKKSKVMPGVAKSFTKSKDGLTYTYNLRHNAKWNDGTPVTAKDFVYGWQRTVDPKTKAENAYMFSGVTNADAITAGKKDPSTLGIKTDGKYKVVVTLEHPISYFNLLIATPSFYPQEQKVVEKYGKKYGTSADKIAYDGPYQLKDWDGTGDTWHLVKNQKYFNKDNIHIDTVNYQVVKEAQTGLNMYQDGQLDQVQLHGDQVQNESKDKAFKLVPDAANIFVQLNLAKASSPELEKALRNENIRQALSIILDRKSFVKNGLDDGSQAAKGMVSRGMASDPKTGKDFADVAAVPSATDYDKARAKKLWKKGMAEIGAKTLSFNLTSDDDDTHKTISQYLQGQWQNNLPGLKVVIKTVPKATRIQYLMNGNFDVIISGWSPEYNDPATFLNMFVTGNTYNFGKYSNPEYDKQMKIANTTASATTRWNAMVKAQKILTTDESVITIYQQSLPYLRNPKLQNYVQNPAGNEPGWRGASLKN
ncbi:peptide ABC transporter substrate-binding protein [Lacticaseibacillus zhaodongensis]|uniref:peptide ABC transporter substrate-binding protein n=1 Tax=Lacticaseibacillus zhaodongensis TaxID=2668065 RepID=UPI0018AFF88F|nr:peptide ABC transporter substrate-binding protein [Lacticaseibacillus zhaodongensis]